MAKTTRKTARKKLQGLTEAGSTRSWRELRARKLGSRCSKCGSTRNLQLNHKRPRRSGGGDSATNVSTLCRSCNATGRPKGS